MNVMPITASGIRETGFQPALFQPVQDTPSQDNAFSDLLTNVVRDAHQSQIKADSAVQGLVTGQNSDVHQVMLAMEQARLSMMLVVEVRNKMVEAYQELSRMPM